MNKIYYSEEFECYILQQKHIKNNRHKGIVILNVKGLNKKEIINKLIDKISNNCSNNKYYKKILGEIIKNN